MTHATGLLRHPSTLGCYAGGGREFYYCHRFDNCPFFRTLTYLCAKTQIVCVISFCLGDVGRGVGEWGWGLLGNFRSEVIIGFTRFLSLELTNLIKQRENMKR